MISLKENEGENVTVEIASMARDVFVTTCIGQYIVNSQNNFT